MLSNLAQYETLIHEVFCQSGRTHGRKGTWFEVQACTILSKIGLTALSSLYFIPGSTRFNGELWDISTLATLSRSIIEAYCALRYIAVEETLEAERDLRQLVWRFHEQCERLMMLKKVNLNSTGIPKAHRIRDELRDELKEKIEKNLAFQFFKTGRQKEILGGGNCLLKERGRICKDAGISESFYRAEYKYLSSYAHPSPVGLNFLYGQEAGNEESIATIETIVETTIGFLAMTIRDFAEVFPDQAELLPGEVLELIEKWEYIFTYWDSSHPPADD
ncbi:MAG: DUF5677 domain-containing protein [Kiritimatiellales bacterium]|nr:DUF5677 domain-containing protein [Kiritimatiellales bacterium]MCF7863582.1 DUF5677 domain-containing protein [Kiritimatiellales bacterium]